MAADDWLAILFVLGRPDLDVTAITVTGTGEAHCEPGVRHALDLAALAGQPDIPVACGRETPLAGTHAFPQPWRQRVDSFLGLTLPQSPSSPSAESAVTLLTTTLESSAGARVTLLALGPLTNPAELLRQSPDVGKRIAAIYVMGGAVEVDGNVGASGVGIDNRFAEWNIYADPLAADAILRSGLPITLVPLDATNHVPMTTAFVDRFAAEAGTPEARFAKDLFGRLHDDIAAGFTSFWDPFAAAVLADDTLAQFGERALGVVQDEGPESGRIVSVQTGPATRFATTADAQRFEALFIDTLNGRAN
jgi:inosine-uridine nucleoside N-ribohydrolase